MKKFMYGFLLLLLPAIGKAQSFWELELFVGAATYMGDLAKPITANFDESNLALGLSGTYYFNPQLALRAGLYYGKISGDDFDYEERENRGINFENKITEISVTAQWHPFGRYAFADNGMKNKTISPYLFTGVGASFGNRETDYTKVCCPADIKEANEDMKVEEPALRIAIPIGGGVKFDLGKKIYSGFDLGWRAVFTDYLDGVSEVGNPEKSDWYIFGGATLGFRLGKISED